MHRVEFMVLLELRHIQGNRKARVGSAKEHKGVDGTMVGTMAGAMARVSGRYNGQGKHFS